MTVDEKSLDKNLQSSVVEPDMKVEDVDDERFLSLDKGVEGEGTIDFVGSPEEKLDISVSQEETRAKIALTFTQIFLLLVFLSLVGPFFMALANWGEDPVETAKALLTAVASVLAGPFGFIVGFYFKERND